MEIKPEKNKDYRLRFLWLLLLANVVLIFGVWQYHRLLVEVSDGATLGFVQRLFRRGTEGDMDGQAMRIALLRSEPTAISFGENRDIYYNLVDMWENFLETEEFGYRVVDEVPQGEAAEPFNLLILPATRNMSNRDREATKRFLRSGRGVFMTWASGTRDEYGQWQRFSLLHEIAGLDFGPAPPVNEANNMSKVLLSGGYPLTANLYPGSMLRISASDQPLAAVVREGRTLIDGVWTDPENPSYSLHNLRDRASVVHGNYFKGRFAWIGFTIGSVQDSPGQQNAFATLLRSSLHWAANQVHVFKPVWPDDRMSVVSVTQNIKTADDIDADILALCERYNVPVTFFVNPMLFEEIPDAVRSLQAYGEISILVPDDQDYDSLDVDEQRRKMRGWRQSAEDLLGQKPKGIRFYQQPSESDQTLDAAVRAGFEYITSLSANRMVPEPVRTHRPMQLVTRPRTLWRVPEMPYIQPRAVNGTLEETMRAQHAKISILGGYYGLSFRPSTVGSGFLGQFDAFLQNVLRQEGQMETVGELVELWEGWDNIRIAVRHVSPDRASLRISNTWTEEVRDIVINLEMPFVQPDLEVTPMTIGTRAPDLSHVGGVRWQVRLDRLRPGGNVSYYIDVDPAVRPERQAPVGLPGEDVDLPQRGPW